MGSKLTDNQERLQKSLRYAGRLAWTMVAFVVIGLIVGWLWEWFAFPAIVLIGGVVISVDSGRAGRKLIEDAQRPT